MAKITEVSNTWDLRSRIEELTWLSISKKLGQFNGSSFYMIELAKPLTVAERHSMFSAIVPWLQEHAGVGYLDWVSYTQHGLCFIKDYNIAFQFYLTFGSQTFA
jgi:hypothetical protein